MVINCDVVFRDICYEVSSGFLKKEKKQILKGVSGAFKTCELTAIVGTSGCGKTTLMNILSGYTTDNVSGDIEIGNVKRSYIMQMENLHELFSIQESMMFSTNVRNGSRISKAKKEAKVHEVLESLGLENNKETMVKNLSGGQMKRLSIAQELLDDPSVIFLDEPTTGLDCASASLCIKLLKKLAMKGKTIVCTIHTPSGLLLKQFDHMYAMTEGCCIYQGSSENLVLFLSESGLNCPESYNPCDFLTEIANGEHGSFNDELCKKIGNGKIKNYRFSKLNAEPNTFEPPKPHVPSTFFNQFYFLMIRNFVMMYRDIFNLWLRIAVHVACSLIVGFTYVGVGNDATRIISNMKMLYAYSLLMMFTSFYSMAVRFPLEEAVIKRETFNKWFSTEAYYIAMSVADIPLTIFCTVIAMMLIYHLMDQPNEIDRIARFLSSQVLLSFTSQGMGMMVGSCLNLMQSQFLSSAVLPITLLFGGFFITVKDANYFFKWIFDGFFVKQAGDCGIASLMGYNRSKMNCDQIYCHYENPKKLLDDIGVNDTITLYSILNLVFFLFFFRIVAYVVMRNKLKK